MGYLDQLASMLRGQEEPTYAVPATPSFDVMQKATIPDYQIRPQPNQINSWVSTDAPNVVNLGDMFTQDVKKTPEQQTRTKGHELQHQIEITAKQKGQVGDNAVIEAWRKNSQQLGYDPFKTEEGLKKLLAQPEVSDYFKSLGVNPKSRIMNPERSPLNEVLADLSAHQALTKQSLIDDPVLAKYVLKDPKLAKLVQSTTGMSGFVLGDSDYAPYSLEAVEAWNKPSRKSILEKLFK
jgi:hypothetical protein